MFGTIFAASALLLAADPQAYVLNAPLRVWDVTTSDLNADNATDILAFCSDPESYPTKKSLVAFIAAPDASFSSEPTAQLQLDPDIGTAFIAEVDGQAPPEIVTAGHDRAVVYTLSGDRFRRLSETTFASLLPSNAVEPLFWQSATADLDDDGIDEWLIPTATGYEIRNAQGLIAKVPGHIESETREYGVMAVQHRLPMIHTFQLDDQLPKAIAFLSDRFADFSYGPNWSQHYRFRIPRKTGERWDAFVRMEDIDNSGFPDLLVTQTEGTINLKSHTHLYLATAPFEYPAEPDAEFSTKGSFTTPALKDLNNDKYTDLIFLRVPLGLRNIVNYFFRKKVSVQIHAHYFAHGKFPVKPSDSASITMEAPEGRERNTYAMGDFNGDGHTDAAVGVSADELSIYIGGTKDFISSRAWKTLNVPTFGVARAKDLNGDEVDDLVLFHPAGPHQKRIEVIHF